MKCQKCGKEIDQFEVNVFNLDGTDSWIKRDFAEAEEADGVFVDLGRAWTGYDFDADDPEVRDSIRCPECHEFPFILELVEKYEISRVLMFKK